MKIWDGLQYLDDSNDLVGLPERDASQILVEAESTCTLWKPLCCHHMFEPPFSLIIRLMLLATKCSTIRASLMRTLSFFWINYKLAFHTILLISVDFGLLVYNHVKYRVSLELLDPEESCPAHELLHALSWSIKAWKSGSLPIHDLLSGDVKTQVMLHVPNSCVRECEASAGSIGFAVRRSITSFSGCCWDTSLLLIIPWNPELILFIEFLLTVYYVKMGQLVFYLS